MFASLIGRTNKFILKWAGLFGLPFYFFFSKAAVTSKTINPDAGLADIAGQFYGTVIDTAANDFLPGMAIVLSETFNFVADTVAPGVSMAIGAALSVLPGADPPAPGL